MWMLALTAAAGAYTAYSQAQAGRFNQKVARYNAAVAEAQASDALARGAVAEQRYRGQVRTLIGSQRAGYAGQGVDVSRGSAARTQERTAEIGEQDAITIRNNAAREAWGFQVQATDSRMQGDMARRTGDQQALGSLLSTGAGFADGYYRMYGDRSSARPTSSPSRTGEGRVARAPGGRQPEY